MREKVNTIIFNETRTKPEQCSDQAGPIVLIAGAEPAVCEVNELLRHLATSQQQQIIKLSSVMWGNICQVSYFSLASASEGTLLLLPLPLVAYMLCSTVNEFVISGIIVECLTPVSEVTSILFRRGTMANSPDWLSVKEVDWTKAREQWRARAFKVATSSWSVEKRIVVLSPGARQLINKFPSKNK